MIKKTFIIAKKEFKTYFVTPIGYTVIGVFLFVVGYMFYQRLVFFIRQQFTDAQTAQYIQSSLNDAVVKPIYATINVIMLFIVPVITMRLIAEEKRSKTIELLYTSPLNMWEIILGKFHAGLCLVLLALLGTFVYPIILLIGGNPDLGQISSMYLGLALLSSSYIAIGLLWSSITENQIISAIFTFLSLVFLWVLDWSAQNSSQFISDILSYISVIKHFEYFGQGVISLKDTVYYISLTTILLYLSRILIDPNKNIKIFTRWSLSFVLLVVVNVSVNIHDIRFDVSRDKINTLSEQTLYILNNLKEDVTFHAVLNAGPSAQNFKRAIEQYSYYSRHIKYQILDKQEIGAKFESLTLFYKNKRVSISSLTEDDISSAIVSITRDIRKNIYFINSHGEPDIEDNSAEGISFLTSKIRSYGYEVSSVDLKKVLPKDKGLLIMLAPSKDINDLELKRINNFLSNGGSFILLFGPPVSLTDFDPAKKINTLLVGLGIRITDNIIIDPSSKKMGLGQAVVVTQDLSSKNLISSDLKDPLILPYSRSLVLSKNSKSLCKSSLTSWGGSSVLSGKLVFDDKKDLKGPLDICAYTCVSGDKGCLMVVGNSAFVTNKYINYGSNYDLIMNAISFMLDDKELVFSRTRVDRPGYFIAGSIFVVGFFATYFIPFIMLVAGFLSYYRRKRR
jgi:ABC-2 type transport system permease protein